MTLKNFRSKILLSFLVSFYSLEAMEVSPSSSLQAKDEREGYTPENHLPPERLTLSPRFPSLAPLKRPAEDNLVSPDRSSKRLRRDLIEEKDNAPQQEGGKHSLTDKYDPKDFYENSWGIPVLKKYLSEDLLVVSIRAFTEGNESSYRTLLVRLANEYVPDLKLFFKVIPLINSRSKDTWVFEEVYTLVKFYEQGIYLEGSLLEKITEWTQIKLPTGDLQEKALVGKCIELGLLSPKNSQENILQARDYLLDSFSFIKDSTPPLGYLFLGQCYLKLENIPATIQYFLTAARKGLVEAKYELGYLYSRDKAKRTEALKWYKEAADEGHAEAQYQVASYYESKIGIPSTLTMTEDYCKLTIDYYKLAAAQNHVNALLHLGRLYETGLLREDPYGSALASNIIALMLSEPLSPQYREIVSHIHRIQEKLSPIHQRSQNSQNEISSFSFISPFPERPLPPQRFGSSVPPYALPSPPLQHSTPNRRQSYIFSPIGRKNSLIGVLSPAFTPPAVQEISYLTPPPAYLGVPRSFSPSSPQIISLERKGPLIIPTSFPRKVPLPHTPPLNPGSFDLTNHDAPPFQRKFLLPKEIRKLYEEFVHSQNSAAIEKVIYQLAYTDLYLELKEFNKVLDFLTFKDSRQWTLEEVLSLIKFNDQGLLSKPLQEKVFLWSPSSPQEIQNYWLIQGICHSHGINTPKDLGKAFNFYEKAALLNCPWAQVYLSLSYIKGIGMLPNLPKGIEWAERAAKMKDQMGQKIIGECYLKGIGLKQDISKGIFWLTQSANQGLPSALFLLSHLYYHGKNIPQDNGKAFSLCKEAAKRGLSLAQLNLGLLFYARNDRGVSLNQEKALKWIQRAAENRNLAALYHVGYYHEKGRGTPKNTLYAFLTYEKAAYLGYPQAMYRVGKCYEYSIGTRRNLFKAMKWYQKAATLKEPVPKAQKALNSLKERGLVLP